MSTLVSLIGERRFRQLWAAGAITWTMRWLEILVIGVYVYDRTRSPLTTALMTTLRLIPSLFLGVILGEVAQRFDRKKILSGGLAAMAGVSAVLAALAFFDALSLWAIGAAALMSGLYGATDMSTRRTLIGEVAGAPRLGSAIALDSTTNNATRVAGPFMGGLLLEHLGIEGAFAMAAACYALAAWQAARLDYRTPAQEGPRAPWLGKIREGLAYVRRNRVLMGTLFVTMAVNFWGFSYISMVPVIGRDQLDLSATLIGVLVSAEGVGALAGALTVTLSAPRAHLTRIYFVGSTIFLLAIFTFSLSQSYPLSVAILLAGGIGISGFSTMQSTIMLLATPLALRARVMGVLTMCIGAGPVGLLHVGLLADWLGAPLAIRIIALEGLAAMALAFLLWPELLRLRILAPVETQARTG